MQDLPELHAGFFQRFFRALLRKSPDTHEPLRLQNFHYEPQMRIAHGVKLLAFVRRKLIWRKVASARVAKNQRAIVQNKMLCEKIFRRAEFFAEQTPQSFSAYLRARTIESLHGTFRVRISRLGNERKNFQPVARRRDFAERHACLRHAERSGIHAEKHDVLFFAAIFLEILLVRGAGIVQWVADMRDGRLEF